MCIVGGWKLRRLRVSRMGFERYPGAVSTMAVDMDPTRLAAVLLIMSI